MKGWTKPELHRCLSSSFRQSHLEHILACAEGGIALHTPTIVSMSSRLILPPTCLQKVLKVALQTLRGKMTRPCSKI